MTRRPHRNTHRDANQGEIVTELRRLGFVVHDVSPLGGDVLDLFVGGYCSFVDGGWWVQVEVKTEGGTLTPGERAYIDAHGGELPIIEARCVEDVLRHFGRVT